MAIRPFGHHSKVLDECSDTPLHPPKRAAPPLCDQKTRVKGIGQVLGFQGTSKGSSKFC